MRTQNKKCIDGQIANSNRFSNAFETNQSFSCSAQLIVAGTALGNFKVQCSDDIVSDGLPINWLDVPDSAIAINGSGKYFITKTDISGQFHRLAFIDVSGGTSTGTITANFFSQGY